MIAASGLPFRFNTGLKGRIACMTLAHEYLVSVTVEPPSAWAPAWGAARTLKLWPTAGGLVVLQLYDQMVPHGSMTMPFRAERPQLILLALHSASKMRLCFDHHEMEGDFDAREQKQFAASVMTALDI